MNNENKWTDKIAGSKVVDAVQRIDVYKVQCAINNMKNRKASEPHGIALKILKVGGESCLKSLTIIFNILFDGKSPKVWMLSLLVPIFKGNRDPQSLNLHMGIKLLEHAFKLYEKILDGNLLKLVHTGKMQYQGNADAVFILKQPAQKVRSKNKKLFCVCWSSNSSQSCTRGVIPLALRRMCTAKIFDKWGCDIVKR